MSNSIAKKKHDRFRFLHGLYEATDGDSLRLISESELGKELGLDFDATLAISQYLEGEGLLKTMTLGGQISITHAGIVEVEEAISRPSNPTTHFPANVVNIVHVATMNNSQIQQGTTNSSQVQHNSASESLKETLHTLLTEIRRSDASEDQKALAEAHSGAILSQARVPKEYRDLPSVEKAWEGLKRLSTVLSLGKMAVEAAPIIKAFFGL